MKTSIKADLAKDLSTVDLGSSRGEFSSRLAERSPKFEFKGRSVTSFASWDLLSLYDRRDICGPAARSIDGFGWSSGAGRSVGGLFLEHSRVEQRIAEFFGGEAGILFPTRTQAVLTCVTALFTELDLLVTTASTQAPLADAAALVGSELLVVEDGELQSIAEKCKGHRRVCFVVETVSALTGGVRDVPGDLAFAERIGAWVIVDESAALGIRGLRGAGSADLLRWSPALLARIASFNLVLGFAGTGVVGPTEFRELLLRRSRFLRYEAPEPLALALGVEAALSAAELSVLSREVLAVRAKLLAESLSRQGWSVPCGGEVPIVSISLDSFKACCEVQLALLQRGFLTEALPGKSRGRDGGFLRVLLSTRHTDSDVEALLESFSVVRERRKANSRVVTGLIS